MKDVYYFSHDCNARNDPKILALRSVFGAVGYAVYFMLLEILREQEDYRLKTGKYLYTALSMQMGLEAELIERILNSCINDFSEGDSPLLRTDGEYIWSDSFLKRMEKKNEVKNRLSEAGKKGNQVRWEQKADRHPIATRSLPDRIKGKESKGKEIKEKESKGNKSKEKNNLKSGGERWRDGEFVKEYLTRRDLEPDSFFGVTEEHKREIKEITEQIWDKLVPGKKPSELDERMVFYELHEAKLNDKNEWEAFIGKNRLETLLYAFEAAGRAGKPGNWNYIKGVLRRLDICGAKSLEDAEDRDCKLQDIKDEKKRFL